jgi:hypothetical protein
MPMPDRAIATRRGSIPLVLFKGREMRWRPVVSISVLAFGQLVLSSSAARADTDEIPLAQSAIGWAAFLLTSCWLAYCCRRAIRVGRKRRSLRFSTPRSATGRTRERGRDE